MNPVQHLLHPAGSPFNTAYRVPGPGSTAEPLGTRDSRNVTRISALTPPKRLCRTRACQRRVEEAFTAVRHFKSYLTLQRHFRRLSTVYVLIGRRRSESPIHASNALRKCKTQAMKPRESYVSPRVGSGTLLVLDCAKLFNFPQAHRTLHFPPPARPDILPAGGTALV